MMPYHKCDQKKEKFATGRFHLAGIILACFFLLGLTVSARAGSQVPFKGVATTTLTFVGEPDLVAIISGAGQATHLGHFTLEEDIVTLNFPFYTGLITFTAANGDELFGETVGVLTPAGTVGITTFTGGTGRFENATGASNFIGTAQATSFSVTYDGVISSPGANKK
jgi:hypothetical protein